MSDSNWLRFLSHRPHGLVSPRSETSLQQLIDQSEPRRKSMTRAPSWHALNQADPFEISPYTASIFDEADKCILRAGEETWHNPSIDQIAGALRAAMATKAVDEPLPIEYSSHVLFLLEGYGAVRGEAGKAEAERERHKAVEEHWMIKEARYKTEVKRLELIIHDLSGDGGIEAVAMARAGSFIRGRGGSGAIVDARDVGEKDVDAKKASCDKAPETRPHGRQASILSRERTIDSRSEMRWSIRLRRMDAQHAAAKDQGQGQAPLGATEAERAGEEEEKGEGERDEETQRPSAQVQSRRMRGQGHRREFSFMAGDDRGAVKHEARSELGEEEVDDKP